MIEVVADRSSDGMDGPVKIKDKHEINIHIHHDQQNPVHVLDDKVQQLAYEAARKQSQRASCRPMTLLATTARAHQHRSLEPVLQSPREVSR